MNCTVVYCIVLYLNNIEYTFSSHIICILRNGLFHLGLLPKSWGINIRSTKTKGIPNFQKGEKNNEHPLIKSCRAACWPCACRSCRSRSSCSVRLLPGQTWSETFPSGISGTSRRMGCSYLLSPVSARWWSMCGPCLLAPTHGQIVWSQATMVGGSLPLACF